VIFTKGECMKETYFVEGMKCVHCAAHVSEALNNVNGVNKVKVDLANKSVLVFAKRDIPEEEIEKAITSSGYIFKGKVN